MHTDPPSNMFTSLHRPLSLLNWSNLSSLGKLYSLCWHSFFSTSCIFFTLCLFSFVFLLPLTLDAYERRFSEDRAANNRRCLGGHRTWWSFLNPEFSRIAELNTVSPQIGLKLGASWCYLMPLLKVCNVRWDKWHLSRQSHGCSIATQQKNRAPRVKKKNRYTLINGWILHPKN